MYPLKYSFETEGEAVKPEDKKPTAHFMKVNLVQMKL